MPAMRASYPRPREPRPEGTPHGVRAYLLALGRRRLHTLGRFGRGHTPAVRAFTRASPADCDLAGVDPGTATDRTRGAGPGRRKGRRWRAFLCWVSSASGVPDHYPCAVAPTWRQTGSIFLTSLLTLLTKGAGGHTKGVKPAFVLT